MRLRFGPVPDDPGFAPQDGGWTRLGEPSFGKMMLMAAPLSITLAAGIAQAWGAVARMRGVEGGFAGVVTLSSALSLLLAFAALLLVHELTHAVTLPGAGLTAATTLGFWPKTLTPYVAFEGELPRNRHIVVGLMPFIALSVVPVIIGLSFSVVPPWAVALGMINAFGASGDLLGVGLLALRVPSTAIVRNKGLETWWRPARD